MCVRIENLLPLHSHSRQFNCCRPRYFLLYFDVIYFVFSRYSAWTKRTTVDWFLLNFVFFFPKWSDQCCNAFCYRIFSIEANIPDILNIYLNHWIAFSIHRVKRALNESDYYKLFKHFESIIFAHNVNSIY